VLAVTIRNHRAGGEAVLVSTNGGVNFYIGNNARYLETLAVRPGPRWEDLIREPERVGVSDPAAVSSFFYRKGARYFADEPVAATAGLARKLYLFWNAGEIPRSTDVYAERADSLILAALVWPAPLRFPGVVLLPLALVGIVAAWRRDPRARLVALFIGAHAIVVAAFFVTSRYRLPVVPMLAPFAVIGAGWFVARVCAATARARAAATAALAALVIVLALPTRETEMSYRAELEFYRGIRFARHRGELARGIDHLRRATELDPADPRAWFELGNVLSTAGRDPEAVEAWERAALADPWDTRPRRRIARVLASAGDFDGAARALRASLASAAREPAHYAHEHYMLGTVEGAAGRYGASLDELRVAAELDPAYVRKHAEASVRHALAQPGWGDTAYWRGLGELLRDVGLPELARAASARAD
jgi:tetratricopeptide (TPR) repeat protein